MTESNWQGDMLRRMAQQSSAEDPAPTNPQPDPAPPAHPAAPPAYQPAEPPAYQGPPGATPQPAPTPEQQNYAQQYPEPQYYPPQQQYPQQPYGQPPYPQPPPEPYPQQGYPQQGYAPQPPPPPYQEPYHPPEPQYPPYQQPPPGQAPYQPAPAPGPNGRWGPPPPPTPQSDQIGRPLAPEDDDDGVFRSFRRLASEAAYLIGASGRIQRDVDNIATIRRPIAIMRRIGVLSPVTNGGTSTLTALLSTMLAAQRSDRVVAIDSDPSGAELSRRLEQSLGSGPIEGVTLVRSDTNVDALRATLADVQGQGSRDVGLAVVDCPGSMYDDISTEMASSGHCTVLVLPSVQHVAEYCLAQLDQLTPAGQDVLLTRGVIVISMVQDVDPSSVGWLVDAFHQRGLEPVVLPYDAHIAHAWPLQSEELHADTRRALLELAARVVDTVTRTAG